jgi:hypothetical protein
LEPSNPAKVLIALVAADRRIIHTIMTGQMRRRTQTSRAGSTRASREIASGAVRQGSGTGDELSIERHGTPLVACERRLPGLQAWRRLNPLSADRGLVRPNLFRLKRASTEQ